MTVQSQTARVHRLPSTPLVRKLLRGVCAKLHLPLPLNIGELAALADHARGERTELDLATTRRAHAHAVDWLRSAGVLDELDLDRHDPADREAILVLGLAAHELLALLASTEHGYFHGLTVILPMLMERVERRVAATAERCRANSLRSVAVQA